MKLTHYPPFRYYLRVRYAECDAQKVVFNSRYAEYVDVALNEFLRAVGFDTARLIASGLDFQLVKQTIEWKSAARFDDVLEIALETVRLGTTSFTCRATFRRPNADAILTTIETVYVLVETDTMKKTPLPAAFREAVESGARGRIVDHAAHYDLDPSALTGTPRARSMRDDVIGPPEEANQK